MIYELVRAMNHRIDGLMQDYSISIANALEKLQSCTKPSEWVYHSHVIVADVKSKKHRKTFSRSFISMYFLKDRWINKHLFGDNHDDQVWTRQTDISI